MPIFYRKETVGFAQIGFFVCFEGVTDSLKLGAIAAECRIYALGIWMTVHMNGLPRPKGPVSRLRFRRTRFCGLIRYCCKKGL